MLRPEQPTIASSERRIELVEPDLAQNMFSRLYSATKIDVYPSVEGKFAWSWKMLPTGPMTVINGHAIAGSADVAGAIPYYLLSFVQQGTVDFKSLKSQTVVTADKGAAMVNADVHTTTFTHAGTQTLNIRIEPNAILSHAAALLGTTVSTMPRFALPLDLLSGPGADINRLCKLLCDALTQPDTPLGSPHVLAHLREALIGMLLLGSENTLRSRFQKPPPYANLHAVQLAEEILDARAAEPISIAEIAAQTGIGLRSLERSYKAARGCTLRTFLKARRLELAHQRLCAATPGTTVTQILYASGFSRPGEFSQAYRQRFGVAPSETLRRALGNESLESRTVT